MRQFSLLLFVLAVLTAASAQTPQNPLLYNGMAVNLGEQPSVAVAARQLLVHPDAGGGCFSYSYSADPADSVLTLDCAELGANPVTIWIHPSGAPATQVSTYILLQDNLNACSGTPPAGALSVRVMNGLSKTIAANGQIYVCVDDFLIDPDPSFDYAIRKAGTGTGFPMSNGFPAWVIPFNCDELGTQIVEIWARDGAGAEGYANSYVIIQDLLEVCDFPSAGAGLPSVQLYSGLAATFDLGGQIRLTANQLQRRSVLASPDCPLYFSFSADLTDTVRVFDYDDGALGFTLVEVWATDSCTGLQSRGESYILLQDNSPAGACGNLETAPCNDQRTDAVPLNSAASCWQYYTTRHATTESNEPEPTLGACGDPNTWCDQAGADNSVWFTFTAPPSGSVALSTSGMNTQLAVWQEVGADLLLIGANDDAPNATAGEAALVLSCLEPGAIYFVQIDGFDGAEGQFGLRAEDAGIACLISGAGVNALQCGEEAIGSVASTGTGAWQHLSDATGNVAASFNDRGQPLGTVSLEYKIHGGPALRVDSAGTPYLDRNWTVTVQNQPAGPVRLRLYVSAAEFQTLAADPAGPGTPAEAFATKVSGDVCGDYATGGALLTPAATWNVNSNGDLVFEFEIDGFSSFYLHGPELLTQVTSLQAGTLVAWPNPVTERLALQHLPAGRSTYRVLDPLGREVQRGEVSDREPSIATGHWTPGWYTIRVEGLQTTLVGKVVKQ